MALLGFWGGGSYSYGAVSVQVMMVIVHIIRITIGMGDYVLLLCLGDAAQ